MSSLSGLVKKVLSLTPEPGRTAAERPQEMNLLGKVISRTEIDDWHRSGVIIKRTSFVRQRDEGNVPEVQFQVINGEDIHTIIATFSSSEGLLVFIQETKQVLPFTTVEELHDCIVEFASNKCDA